jgi:hypothetical protein
MNVVVVACCDGSSLISRSLSFLSSSMVCVGAIRQAASVRGRSAAGVAVPLRPPPPSASNSNAMDVVGAAGKARPQSALATRAFASMDVDQEVAARPQRTAGSGHDHVAKTDQSTRQPMPMQQQRTPPTPASGMVSESGRSPASARPLNLVPSGHGREAAAAASISPVAAAPAPVRKTRRGFL